MNTIPKLKIKEINLQNNDDIKTIFFKKEYTDSIKFFWNQPNKMEIAGIDIAFSSEFSSLSEFETISNNYRELIKSNHKILTDLNAPIIFVGTGFDINSKSEEPWEGIPSGKIFIPRYLYINQNGLKRLLIINTNQKNEIKSDSQVNQFKKKNPIPNGETSKDDFLSMIDNSILKIDNKDVSKIVLSREKKFKYDFNPKAQFDFLTHAEKKFKNCINFLYDFKEQGIFFGVTPENLFKIKAGVFYSEALAGTFKTDEPPIEKTKELEEHRIVVKYLHDQISKFSSDLEYTKNPVFLHLSEMTHLKTKFKSTLKNGIDGLDIIYKLHPTPAVSGYPKDIAIKEINKIENHNRGWYSGTLGWIDSNNNAHFIVAIRSGIVKNNQLHLYAGCGITKKSDKNLEYQESELKFNSILSILNNE